MENLSNISVVAHSVGPNQQEIITFKGTCNYEEALKLQTKDNSFSYERIGCTLFYNFILTTTNIQQLAIEMKKAIDASTPVKLMAGEWHLPFVEETDDQMEEMGLGFMDDKMWNSYIKLSAARCTMTSYSRNKGKSIESELDLSERLMKDRHWSPFEHQAMAIDVNPNKVFSGLYKGETLDIPAGTELRLPSTEGLVEYGSKGQPEIWSRNFKGMVQARALLDS